MEKIDFVSYHWFRFEYQFFLPQNAPRALWGPPRLLRRDPDHRTSNSRSPCINAKANVFLHRALDFRGKNLGQNSLWNSAACCFLSRTKLNLSMSAWTQYARCRCRESIKFSTAVTISWDLCVFRDMALSKSLRTLTADCAVCGRLDAVTVR